ncbi:FYVE zinc finger [Dillenia turbinata]|uniref:FYVE zinc finger n=1 Tax=Dillenia turbinata TaxID=194707 RepID=A0AAN8UKW6_9MAGN
MLEKIGLPAKPSLRGNNWVVDASHCQGCSSQFTFINRKHHCRRCGGMFCGNCTQQRMILRGQGDSPVRICDPCKKLEEAARFEMRHGHRNKAGRGASKLTPKDEDELLLQILGNGEKGSSSSRSDSYGSKVTGIDRPASAASSSNVQEIMIQDEEEGILRAVSLDDHALSKTESTSPEELRQQAVEERKKYKILKGEGKSEEALRAFKRGKELERQAAALEISLRKSRKRALSSRNVGDTQEKKDDSTGSSGKNRPSHPTRNEKDVLASELRELGWSDMDLQDADKKPTNLSLEGELSTLLQEGSQKPESDRRNRGKDKSEVVALKKKALMLKREGKLAEAKEELRRAKVLEKQLEEQEFLAEADESDDEILSLIHSMDTDDQEDLSSLHMQVPRLDFDHLMGAGDDLAMDGNFEVTDEDLNDAEMAAALKSLGWNEDHLVDTVAQSVPIDREALSSEILSLKREALKKKREGDTAEAMSLLKQAKVLERDLDGGSMSQNAEEPLKSIDADGKHIKRTERTNPKLAPKSKVTIQKELLSLKKEALALRREGKIDEAEEVLKKGKVLEQQLEEMDDAVKKVAKVDSNKKEPELAYFHPDFSRTLADDDDGQGDVTDHDMHDPSYLSLLKDLGWKDEDEGPGSFPQEPSKEEEKVSVQKIGSHPNQAPSSFSNVTSRKSKVEIQRELLGLKRKALALRRQGETDEAEEILRMAKVLEAQLAEVEAPTKDMTVQTSSFKKDDTVRRSNQTSGLEGDDGDVTEKDMHDPALLKMLGSVGWDDEVEPLNVQSSSIHATDHVVLQPISKTTAILRRTKGEIQRELLGLKRKASALRRQGRTEEVDEVLRMAKDLEAQLEETEAPQKVHPSDVSKVTKVESMDSLVHQNPGKSLIEFGEMTESTTLGPAVEKKAAHPVGQDVNLVDLLSGDSWQSSHVSESKLQYGEALKPDIASLAYPPNQIGSISDDRNTALEKITQPVTKMQPVMSEPISAQEVVPPGMHSSLCEEIIAYKRKAVALKKEGKLAEAKEQLRQAKLLEKELDNPPEDMSPPEIKVPVSKVSSVGKKEHDSLNLAPKTMSSRDRFKLQQESLNHKRQALKLRREGRTEEADAEFELAKALEAQLEQLAANDSTGSSTSVDNVGVEDLLDPQLLSALKEIGLDQDVNIVSKPPTRPEPPKANAVKTAKPSPEIARLEEQIKAEKVKALNLKRLGKQAEALEALRKAKLLEKKLNSLATV